MIAELGHFSLILALIAALIQGFLPLAGTALGVRSWVNVARPAVFANAVFCTFAFCCLAWCFYTSDFSVMNVANNSNSMLPWFYRLSATWGSHEGSILFWTLLLALWGLAVAVCSRRLPQDVMARVIGVMGLISVGLTLFMLLTSDPFIRLFPAAHEGRDLNPLLQDPGMVFHPPLLYMGYVGMVVPFAFAVAALIGGRLDAAWARWTRPWTSAAWIFLTLGISLGSYWSYYELGWGGWWFWDPVENSSFVPWLLMTAQLHALVLLRFRAHLTKTVLFFCIVSFALCLLGTFIVRSGVIQSVHAFASDPNRGAFLLVISLLMVVPALFLFMIRAPKFESAKQISGIEDISLVLAVLLLAVTAVCVLFGTLYPLVHEALGKGSLSVGAPYFNSIFAPMTILAALMIGAVQLKKSPMWTWGATFILSAIAALYCGFFAEVTSSVYTTAGVFSALWIICSFMASLRSKKHKNFFALVAHLGIAVSIIGVIGDKQYSQEAVVRMGPGQGRPLGDVIFVYEETRKVDTNAFFADEGKVLVLNKNEDVIDELHPQRQTYKSNGMEMTAAGISHGFFRDFYVSMGNRLSSDEFLVRLSIRPLVSWIWIGGLIMLLSAVFSSAWRRKEWSQS
mgnify:FL=1